MADKLMQATQPFTCTLGGVPFAVGAGDIFSEADEVVRKHGAFFRAVTVRDSSVIRRPLPRHPGAETATAGPGELRTVTQPERRKKTPVAAAAPSTDGPSEV